MSELDDQQLLAEFARSGSEAAFQELVSRHAGLVYSTAFRFCNNTNHAEEIAQAVFIILARKAETISPRVVLSGWLYQTTRLTAANFVKREIRRRRREQEAVMQSDLNNIEPPGWETISPLLDEAMGTLGESDRNAVLLRYFENRTSPQIGAALRMTEETARKRVNRAVEKLRRFFVRRGVTVSSGTLSGIISAHSIQPVSAMTVKSLSVVAAAKGATASITTSTLIKGALNVMAWTKAKTAIAVGVGILLATGTATVVKTTYFPAINDAYFQTNYQRFQNLPRGLFTLRPTHFTTPAEGVEYSGETSSPSGEHVTLVMGRNRSFAQLIANAYGGYLPYTIFPPNTPQGRYDYLCTILDGQAGARLQTAIRKRLGYVATWQERNTEVLLLKSTFASPALKPASGANNSQTWRDSDSRLEFRNRFLWQLVNEIERTVNMPVLDQTGLSNAFDFDFNCARTDLVNRNLSEIDRALNRLGLELISTNLPAKVLVVEKTK